jgi:hypothetical protein
MFAPMSRTNNSITSEDIAVQVKAMEVAAYQRGWKDAIEAIKETVSQSQQFARNAALAEELAKPPAHSQKKNVAVTDTLYRYIKANPGRSRAEVRQALLAQNVTDSDESLKTSIRRLLRSKRIREEDGKIY